MKKLLKRLLVFGIPVALLAGAALVAFHSGFYIQEIIITGNDRLTDEEIIEVLPLGIGEHILTIPIRRAERLISADPRVSWVEVRRSFGGKVIIIVREQYPAMLFAAEKIWGITEGGVLIPFEETFQIPNLIVLSCENLDASTAPYKKLEESRIEIGLEFYRNLRAKAPQYLDRISEIHVTEKNEITAVLTGDGLSVEFGSGDPELKFARLSAILDKMGESRSSAVKIDLRYTDQAVVQLGKVPKQKVWG